MVVPIASSFSSAAPHRPRPMAAPGAPLLSFPERPRRRNPLELWHLLSLDAPTVAALWTWFLASANGLILPWTSILSMAAAVWLLYAGDRLLDARPLAAGSPQAHSLEARHRFHHRHRQTFRCGVVAASLLLAALLPTLPAEALHLYLIEGSFLAAYFLLIHAGPSSHRLPKEFAVGLFFAAAVFIPTISRQPVLRTPMLGPAFLFAALCTLNCLFIYAWEHSNETAIAVTHFTTRLALRHLRALAVALVVAAFALGLGDATIPWTLPAAIALASASLLGLHQGRRRIHSTTLRAAADLALLTPALFLFGR